jgi:hypothetical protein
MENSFEFSRDRDIENKGWQPKPLIRYGKITTPQPLNKSIHFECDEKKEVNQPNILKPKKESNMEHATNLENFDLMEVPIIENIAEKMKSTVLECIEKIQKDPKYIPQANAINSQLQTLINLKKLEIENDKLKHLLGKTFEIPPKPTIENIEAYFLSQGVSNTKKAVDFFNYYEGNGWKRGNTVITNWRAVANAWILKDEEKATEAKKPKLHL